MSISVNSSALGTTSIDGLVSGLDTTSIISSLTEIRSRPITLLNNQITERQQDLKSYQSLTARVLTLLNSANSLADRATMSSHTATVSDSGALLATAGSGAAVGTYDLVVSQLAQCQKITSGRVADTSEALGATGDLRVNGHTISLQTTDTIVGLRDKINHAGAGVTASILTVSSTDHRLVLRSQSSGAAGAIDLVDSPGGALQNLEVLKAEATTKHALTAGMATDYVGSRTDAVATTLGLSTPPAGTISVNGTSVAVDLSTDSLDDLAERINSTVTGVIARVASDTSSGDTRYRLELTGATAPTLMDDGGVLNTLGLVTHAPAHEVQAAQDAEFTLDGYAMTRSSNSVDDALAGVSLDLLAADTNQTITLTISADTSSVVTGLQQMVSDYNSVMQAINTGMSYDSDSGSGGVFFADANILMLQESLQSAATAPAGALGGSLTLMSQIGLTTDSAGLLSLNTSALQRALQDDPDAVARLLCPQAETTDSEVQYMSAGSGTADSGAAGYAVEITHAATKATAQSAALINLAQDETLTINENLAVSLQAGMTLQQAADKLNTMISGNKLSLTASVAEGRLQIGHTFYGSNYGFSVKSSLADGAGGTDLGGASAGAVQTYYGENVAGTIGGHKATGWGQFLTGAEGGVRDLKLQVTSATTASKGVVKMSQGLASRMSAFITQATDTGSGLLTRATTSVTDQIDDLSEAAGRLQQSVDAYTEDLQLKFATLEGVLARNQSLLSYITAQTSTLAGLTSDSNA